MLLNLINEYRCFGGTQGVYSHFADSTNCEMRLSVFVPPQAENGPVPVVTFLSGLTCTEENFTTKAGAQRYAAEHGLMVVAPDTSPRGEDVADDNAYDLGQGAGFYVDARMSPWSANYLMYSYVTQELPQLIADNFPADKERQGIFGHSMGGHGALTIALKNPGKYKSLSAFAPIVAPMQCPWGKKALGGYLGPDKGAWQNYDATELIRSGKRFEGTILIAQGSADNFLEEQLKPHLFAEVCKAAGQRLELRIQDGYDHSYYLMASFMEEHIRHHAQALNIKA